MVVMGRKPISMKIEFNTRRYMYIVSTHQAIICMVLNRWLRTLMMSYRSWNTAHLRSTRTPKSLNLQCQPRKLPRYTMPETMMNFGVLSSLSASIQVITCYHRGSGNSNKSLQKFFSSCLKVAKNIKIIHNFKRVFLNNWLPE